MNISHEIRSWLQIAFSEPVDRINESYFFDRRNAEFYSVFITDYFLTDPNSEKDDSNSPYSRDELAILAERIDRQEDKSSFILSIPRLTTQERKEMMQTFLGEQDLLNSNELQSIINSENGRTSLDFNTSLPSEAYKDWSLFKFEFIQKKIDSFCNLNNIDLEVSCLWTDKKMTTVTLDIKDNPATDKEETKKSWWKFWKTAYFKLNK